MIVFLDWEAVNLVGFISHTIILIFVISDVKDRFEKYNLFLLTVSVMKRPI